MLINVHVIQKNMLVIQYKDVYTLVIRIEYLHYSLFLVIQES